MNTRSGQRAAGARKASALVDCAAPGLAFDLAAACAFAAAGRVGGGAGLFLCDVT